MSPEPVAISLNTHKTFSQEEFDLFAKISGDNNPIHVDPQYSANSRFGRTVSHGMLLYSVIWGLIKNHFPTARQQQQYLMFPAPTYTDEPMTVQLTGTRSGNRCEIKGTMTRDQDGEVTCIAETVIELEEQ
jgi:acyl dehydratase